MLAEMLSSCMQCRACAVDKAESPSPSDRKISNCQLGIVSIKGVSWIYIGRCSLHVVFCPFFPTCIFKTLQNYTVLDFGKKKTNNKQIINFVCFLSYLALNLGFLSHRWQI